jgi:RNase H-fold protein (predicted Holliday junction resolvase)
MTTKKIFEKRWITQNIKIEELELFFKVGKETLNKVNKDYVELENELEELKRDVKRYFYLDEKLHVDRLTVLEAQEKCELAVELSRKTRKGE